MTTTTTETDQASANNSLQELTKSPVYLEIDGKQLRLSPLEIGDLGEITSYLENKVYVHTRNKLRVLGDAITAEERHRILSDADAMVLKLKEPDSPEARATLESPDAIGFMLWLLLRRESPSITQAEASAMVTRENIKAVTDAIERASGQAGKGKAAG